MVYKPIYIWGAPSCTTRDVFFNILLVGGWATPLKNMSSSIGMTRNPRLMGKCKKWQPNHQAFFLIFCIHFFNKEKHILYIRCVTGHSIRGSNWLRLFHGEYEWIPDRNPQISGKRSENATGWLVFEESMVRMENHQWKIQLPGESPKSESSSHFPLARFGLRHSRRLVPRNHRGNLKFVFPAMTNLMSFW